MKAADIIPLTSNVLAAAAQHQTIYGLTPQDALVYASVIEHLTRQQAEGSCFLNRNSRDFSTPEILTELNHHNCKMIASFDLGYQYIQAKGTE